jgi:hypothetical protein
VKADAEQTELKAAELARENEWAAKQLVDVQAECDRLGAERDRLGAECDRLRAIEASTTWRATAPLRAAVARLPGPARRKR